MADIKDRMKNTIDSVADKTQAAKKEGEAAVDRARETIGDAAEHAREKVQEWAGDARDAVQHAGDRAERWAAEAYDTASDRLSDFRRDATIFIRNHPIPAILIGFGVGLLIGRTTRMI